MKKIISILVLVLLVSGCTNTFNFLGGGQEEVKEMSEDVVTVENINVLPTPPILTEDKFSLSYQIVSQEEDDDVIVTYSLLDDGICSYMDGQTFPKGKRIELVPGQTEFVEWTFDTPTSNEIANIGVTCPVMFKISYNYFAESEIDVNVINDDRYMQQQQAGTFTTFTPTLTVGRGPIKIYMELGATLPVRTDNTLPVYITVKDKGDGLMKEIPAYNLVLQVPKEFSDDVSCDVLSVVPPQDAPNTEYVYFWNKNPISFVSKETFKIKCTLKTPSANVVTLEKTYFLAAYYLNYDYDILKEVRIDVEPMA